MKVQKEELENSQVQITIEVDPADVQKAKQQAAREYAKKVRIPGFRPGKAPYHMVVSTVGEEAILDEAIQSLLPEMADKAIEETETQVFSYEDIEPKITNLEPLTFQLTVPVVPTVKLGDMSNITVEPEEIEIAQEQVEESLKSLQAQRALWVPSLGPAAYGDRVTIDLRGDLMDGSTVADDKGVEITLEERTGEPEEGEGPDMAAQLVGMMVNQVKEFPLVYPEGWSDEKLSGRTVLFRATMLDLKQRQEAELDDEFAQSLGEFETLEQLRDRIRENMEAEAKDKEFDRMTTAIIDAMVDEAELVYPQAMVKREVHRRMHQLEDQLKTYGIKLDQYSEIMGQSREDLEGNFSEEAETFVRRSLTLMEYINANEIKVEDEEIERELDLVLASYGPNAESLRGRVMQDQDALSDIVSRLLSRKAVNQLYAEVTGEEPPPLFPEVEEESVLEEFSEAEEYAEPAEQFVAVTEEGNSDEDASGADSAEVEASAAETADATDMDAEALEEPAVQLEEEQDEAAVGSDADPLTDSDTEAS